ncbi:MAG: hypothetical protein ABII79_03980 [bacterium]
MAIRTLVVFLCVCFGCVAHEQTTTNPDISATGDFRVFSHNDKLRTDEAEELNLATPDFELDIAGNLNPNARADAVIAWHGEHNAEIEELFVTIESGLPLGANLRVGKHLLEFGRLNPVHPHAYSFIKRPLPHKMFFGEEGLADVAIRSGFLLPTGDANTETIVGLLKGDAFASHEHGHEEESEEHPYEEMAEPKRGLGFFGRATTFFTVNKSANLAFGSSVVNAVHGFHEYEHEEGAVNHHEAPDELRAWLLGGDVKYKYRPNRNTALQIEAEGIVRIAEQGEVIDDLTSYGGYGYIDYRFRQQYNLGGIFEWIRVEELHEEEGTEEHEIHRTDTWRAGLFVGWSPIEETSLVRLAGHWTEPGYGDGFWEMTLQLVVSLGSHKPHDF